MERDSSEERAVDRDRPADRIAPEDAQPADDGPRDSDLRPQADTEHVVEEKGEAEPER